MNSIELTVFAEKKLTRWKADSVGYKCEFSRSIPVDSTDRSVFQQFPIHGVEEKSKVMSVGDDERSVLIDAEARRFSLFNVGRPPAAYEHTFVIEDLDAARLVDDEAAVGIVHGDCARFLEATVGHSTLSNHEIGLEGIASASTGNATGKQRAQGGCHRSAECIFHPASASMFTSQLVHSCFSNRYHELFSVPEGYFARRVLYLTRSRLP